jgi:SAM-dependent methyltransferase
VTTATPRRCDEYGEAYADVYDEWYPLSADADDAAETIRSLAGGGAVLELGVGTGRVAALLAARGTPVWGLDASASMLAALAAKSPAVRAVQGDMATIALPGDAPPFAVVFIAFNTLSCLPDAAAQHACVRRAAAVLADGGHFAVELLVPPPPPPELRRLELSRVQADRVVLRAAEWLPGEHAVHGHHIEISEGGVRLRPWRLQLLAPAALDEMAGAAGLRLVHRFGGWDRSPFGPCSARHVSVYAVG